MSIIFQREKLFSELWKTPLTTLAPRYGLSDNGLRKVCIALTIPLPRAGHWAKAAVGKAPPTPDLPVTEGRTTFESRLIPRTETRPPVTAEDESWLKDRLKEEKNPSHKIIVTTPPKAWHPVVLKLKNWLEACVVEYQKAIKESERIEKINSKRKYGHLPNFESMTIHWHHPILGSTHRACVMRVSLQTYQRALAIFNSIAFAAEFRGFSVELVKERERLCLTMDSIQVEMFIVENSSYELGHPRLRISVEKNSRYSSIQLKETPTAPLEGELHRVFEYAFRCVVEGKAIQRDRESKKLEAAIRFQYMEEMERQRLQQVKLQIAEDNRRNELVQQANNWETGIRIKAMVANLDAQVLRDGNNSEKFQEWRKWALQVAQSIDPMSVLKSKLLISQ
jgi:hypothetical protein